MAKKLTAEVAGKYLSDVPQEVGFYLNDGTVIRNLESLCSALEAMSNEQFSNYRNAQKNDFYNWVINTIGDTRLANELARTKSKDTTFKKVRERIDSLKKIRGMQNAG